MVVEPQASLRRKILFYTLAVSTAITTVITAISLATDYRKGVKDIHKDVSRIETSLLPAITESMWFMDSKMISVQMEGILNFPPVIEATVTDADGKPVHSVHRPNSQGFQRISRHEFPLIYQTGDFKKPMGRLILSTQEDDLYAELIGKIFYIFVAQALKTLIVSLVILYLIQHFITRHIFSLASQLATADFSEAERVPEVRLDRKEFRRDELQVLVSALNEMLAHLKTQFRQNAKLREKAEELNHEKTRFMALASHELRTPLNAVLGMIQSLQDSPLAPEQKECLDTMSRAGDRLNEIIGSVLDLTSTEAASPSLHPEEFSLRETVLTPIIEEARQWAAKKPLRIEVHQIAELPTMLVGDSKRIQRVLRILLLNAIKFTDEGTIQVSARWKPSASLRRGRLTLEVADTGPGISEEQQKVLFSPFHPLDGSLTRRHGGLGIGLSIARQLVLAMNGDIRVHSTLGQGSAFSVELPLEISQSPPKAEPQAQADSKPTTQGLKVLAVDDSNDNLFLLKTILKKTGWQVEFARNGLEAVEKFSGQPYDVILMDLEMPVMDGFQAALLIQEKIRSEQRPPCPIVVITGHALPEFEERTYSMGCAAFVTKPIRKDDLIHTISRLTGGKA